MEISNLFTIDNIPTSRATDYETNKYIIHYEGGYISLYTKSHSDWGSSENDGKVKEGKVTWKVKAVDNAGNETSSSRTLFVDRTNPKTEVKQINDVLFSSDSFSTTDRTPTIYGKITDSLSSEVASGPKQVEIKVEKKEGLFYKLKTLYTINMGDAWRECDECSKYLPFEYTSNENLEQGTYRITLTGKDKADNTNETSFTLNITTLTQITTPEEKEIIEEEIKPLAPEEKKQVKEELEITKAIEPNILQKAGKTISKTGKNIFTSIGNFISSLFNGIRQGLEFVANGIGDPLASIGNGYNQLVNKAPGVFKNILTGTGNGVSAIGRGINYSASSVGQQIGKTFNFISRTAKNIFVSEPTRIYEVRVVVLSPTSAKISWKTNNVANGKVNYGLDETYLYDIQSEERTKNHEFVLKNLKPATQYHFEVMSHGKNYVYDANRKFKTPEK